MAGSDSPRDERLGTVGAELLAELEAAHAAREVGLAACRQTIRSCSRAIRAVHRLDPDAATRLVGEAEQTLRRAQEALRPHPTVYYAGFLQDAEKEYVEAVATSALIDRSAPPGHADMGVGLAPWLNGLAEAASELRRHLLDRLREGRTERAEELLATMDDVYDLLMTVDYPDAITGGLRRTTDALRAVLERSRADVTTTVLQVRLQTAIDEGVKATGA